MSRESVSAVIVAAGNSTRMGAPKQLLTLGDRPVIVHTLLAFQRSADIDEIVVVTRAEDRDTVAALAGEYGVSKVSAIVTGGADRGASVAHGIAACRPDTAYFAIHDGARPLVDGSTIAATVAAARRHGAAATAVRAKDTVKITDADGFVTGTPDRDYVWQVQTPQIFARDVYVAALQHAAEHGIRATDDCALVEAIDHPVRLVEGSYRNIKITTPEDVGVAEGWLV